MRLRDALVPILGDDLVAIWAHGGTVAVEGPPRAADLDTYVIVRQPIDPGVGQAIEDMHAAIARDTGLEFDAWYVVEESARRAEAPRHAFRSDRRDTSWAVNRAQWLAGRYAHVYGRAPSQALGAAPRRGSP